MSSDTPIHNMKVILGERELSISCPEGAEARLEAAVELFNAEFANRNPKSTYERSVISAGLNLANALLDAQDEISALKAETNARLSGLIDKLDR